MKYLLQCLASYYWRQMRRVERGITMPPMPDWCHPEWWKRYAVQQRRKALRLKDRAERLEQWAAKL